MRIALACPYEWSRPGGVQNHIRSLACALIERDHEIVVLAPGSQSTRRDGRGFDVVTLGRTLPVPANGSVAPISLSPRLVARARSVLHDVGTEVVHAHEPLVPSVSLATVVASSVPIVGTFHASARSSLGYRVAAPVLARALGKIAVRTVVSDQARALVSRYFPGDYTLTFNGVDFDRFASAAPADFGERPTILFLGRLEKRKGLEVLIQAVARLADLRPRLVVAGTGPKERAMRKLAHRLNIDSRWVGHLDDDGVTRAFKAADVYCAPNLGGESFGIVLLESMAAGTPVVASSLEAFESVTGGAARLVTPGDAAALGAALRKMLTNPEERTRLAAAGVRRAQVFDWGRLVPGVEAIYISVAGGD
ncbi:MAG: glycosyltransferase family 4 protein [Actinomycetota bacterium]|nr:glycosyltransferase family 4 protein [Actinomycetota bacterium]